MVWNPSIYLLLYNCPFCDDNMQEVREHTTLYPHLNCRDTSDDKEKRQLYNGPYKSKSDFLDHLQCCIINYNGKMICRYHLWLNEFLSASKKM